MIYPNFNIINTSSHLIEKIKAFAIDTILNSVESECVKKYFSQVKIVKDGIGIIILISVTSIL